MLVAFRSIVVATKAILLNLLSVAAAYGVLVLVFQHGVGKGLLGASSADGIETVVPLLLFVILFGLSMDYHVFILSRIRETFDRGETMDDAVAHGIKSTAGVVTSAAIVMVCVFAVFGALSMPFFKQFGVGLAAAILIDATIVRGVLLPATMKLLGDVELVPAELARVAAAARARRGARGASGGDGLVADQPPKRRASTSSSGRVLSTSDGPAPPRRAVATDSSMFSRPRVECASVEQTIGDARLARQAHVLVAEVEPVREPVHLDRAALLGQPREDGLEVDRVRRPVVDQPPGRVAEAADVRATRAPRARASSAPRARRAGRRGRSPAPSRARPARRRAGRACRRAGCRTPCRAGRGTARAPRSRPRSPRPGGARRRRRARARRRR